MKLAVLLVLGLLAIAVTVPAEVAAFHEGLCAGFVCHAAHDAAEDAPGTLRGLLCSIGICL